MNLVTGCVRAVSGEDNHRDCIAEAAAKIRQQIHAGILAKLNIEYREVNAVGGERAACAFHTIRGNHIGNRTELMIDQREHIVIVIDVKDTWTSPLRRSYRDLEDIYERLEGDRLVEPAQHIES